MSEEKSKRDALRWFRTAQSDFEAASLLLREGKHSHACFFISAVCGEGHEGHFPSVWS